MCLFAEAEWTKKGKSWSVSPWIEWALCRSSHKCMGGKSELVRTPGCASEHKHWVHHCSEGQRVPGLALPVLSTFSCKATSTQQLPPLLLTLLLAHGPCLKASLRYPRLLAELSCMAKEPTRKRKLITFSLHLKFCLQTSN